MPLTIGRTWGGAKLDNAVLNPPPLVLIEVPLLPVDLLNHQQTSLPKARQHRGSVDPDLAATVAHPHHLTRLRMTARSLMTPQPGSASHYFRRPSRRSRPQASPAQPPTRPRRFGHSLDGPTPDSIEHRKWLSIEASNGTWSLYSWNPRKYCQYGFSRICSSVSASVVPRRSLIISAPNARRNDLVGAPWLSLN